MADIGAIRTALGGIKDQDTKRVLIQVFEYLLPNLRLGVPEHHDRATNLQAYWQQSTSASDTSEFSFTHGLLTAPHYAIPVFDLSQPGSRVGGVRVSKAADSRRLYFKADAGSTSAPVTFLVE